MGFDLWWNVDAKRSNLEDTFLAIVRDWGQSIESADSYTYGHCERVAQYAIEVARAVGLDETQQTTVRLGAYLHDLGKVRVPARGPEQSRPAHGRRVRR